MILKIYLFYWFITIGDLLRVDHIETSRQLRRWKDIPKEAFTNSVKKLKIDLFDLPDLSGLQNLTAECAEDMMLLGLALSGSDTIPPDFLHIVEMSKLSIKNILCIENYSARCDGCHTSWDAQRS